MTAVSFSPTISNSSHTLSAHSNPPAQMDSELAIVDSLLSTLTTNPYTLLQPQQSTAKDVLALAKYYLDPLALGITEEQLDRQKDARRKRKRGQKDTEQDKVLGLRKVHVDGFAVEQIWEQARRVLDAARQEVERGIPAVQTDEESEDELSEDSEGNKRVRFIEDGDDASSEEDMEEDEIESDDDLHDDYDEENEDEAMQDIEGDEDEELDGADSEEEEEAEEFKEDKFGLNDGFFSIDTFNRQTEFLEHQDARGEDDAAGSDEEVDWDADPFANGNAKSSSTPKGDRDDEGEEEDEEDEDDGPTFGDMDLNAPEGASDDGIEMEDDEDLNTEDVGGLTNANSVMYADFFAPPAQKAGKSKKKKGRPHPNQFPTKNGETDLTATAEDDDQIERTMSAVHRDLFSDSDHGDSDDSLSDVDPGDPKSRRSTHERRQAKLAEEIRRLEAENVAKRSWTLSGEARAVDRPLNSLLEEDLDFERTGKPVPVITQEVSEDIEALIKRRILAEEFDELVRRRPDDLATGPKTRRGMFNLSDTKSTKGLADIYEEEHLKSTDPNYVSEKDAKLTAAHAEISALWKDVSAKLDSLSSWHYKPKPSMPSLEVRVEAPAISMEDARPTIGGEVGDASILAPQEVYKPNSKSEDADKSEVLTKGGLPVSREEMSREEKAARRKREKERQKKATLNAPTKKAVANGTNGDAASASKSKGNGKAGAQQQKELANTLKKGGVKVIGKKGELTSVDGKAVQGTTGREGKANAGVYKL